MLVVRFYLKLLCLCGTLGVTTTALAVLSDTLDLTSELLMTESVVTAQHVQSLSEEHHLYIVIESLYGDLTPGETLEYRGKAPDPFFGEHKIPEVLWVKRSALDFGAGSAVKTFVLREILEYRPEVPRGFYPLAIRPVMSAQERRDQLHQFKQDISRAITRVEGLETAMLLNRGEARRTALLALIETIPKQRGVLTELQLGGALLHDAFAHRVLRQLAEDSRGKCDTTAILEVIARTHVWLGRSPKLFSLGVDFCAVAQNPRLSSRHRVAALFALENGSHAAADLVDLTTLLSDPALEVRRATARLLSHHLRIQGYSRGRYSVQQSRKLLEAWQLESDPLTRRWIEWGVADQRELKRFVPEQFLLSGSCRRFGSKTRRSSCICNRAAMAKTLKIP